MIRLALLLGVLAPPVSAQIQCDMQDTACPDCAAVTVQFTLDPAQFVAPQDPDDPPRRQVTFVQMGNREFSAEAIMMANGVTGFHREADAFGSLLMIVQPDGSARLSRQPDNTILEGTCTGS